MNSEDSSHLKFWMIALITPILISCQSTAYLSTQAVLPNPPPEFEDADLKVKVEENCSSGWCDSISATFTNLSSAKVILVPTEFRLKRSNTELALSPKDTEKSMQPIQPGTSKEITLKPTSLAPPLLHFKYPKLEKVVCGVKSETQCPSSDSKPNDCAGQARAYYESYVATGSWIQLQFTYQIGNVRKRLKSPNPSFVGSAPSLSLSVDPQAPSWGTASDEEIVFFKVECDKSCACKTLTRRQLFSDDIMKPIAK